MYSTGFSLHIVAILVAMETVNSLKISGSMDSTYKETTFVHINLDPGGLGFRLRRDVEELPNTFHVQFMAENKHVDLNLTRSYEINPNVPVHIFKNGDIKQENLGSMKGLGFYQDFNKGSSILLKCPHLQLCQMFGSFHLDFDEYLIEPEKDIGVDLSISGSPDETPGNGLSSMVVKHIVFHQKINLTTYDDYTEPEQRGAKSNRAKLSRHARAIGDFHVEVLLVYDFSAYMFWYDLTKATTAALKTEEAKNLIRQYSVFLINGMDLRFQSTSSYGTNINILLGGLIIVEKAADATWTENIKSTTGNVDASMALSAFGKWVQVTSLPGHDYAMLLTRYRLVVGGTTGISGLSTSVSVCKPFAQCIVQHGFSSVSITLAAHELGHGLGADHDGQRNTCADADGYIMATSTFFSKTNQWSFSSCSVLNYFQPYIDSLGKGSCMSVLSGDSNASTFYSSYGQKLLGQVYTVDEQCIITFGQGSYMCRNAYASNIFLTICTLMYCKTVGSTGCSGMIPGEGTPCGSKMWCDKGKCVSSIAVPANCIYGDQTGVITSGLTCASIAKNSSENYRCYNSLINLQCCSSCLSVSTGISGCEYGNMYSWCSSLIRRQCYTYENNCCAFCGPLKSAIPGCKYGNKVSGCTLASCANNAVNCCETCNVLL